MLPEKKEDADDRIPNRQVIPGFAFPKWPPSELVASATPVSFGTLVSETDGEITTQRMDTVDTGVVLDVCPLGLKHDAMP